MDAVPVDEERHVESALVEDLSVIESEAHALVELAEDLPVISHHHDERRFALGQAWAEPVEEAPDELVGVADLTVVEAP